MLRLGEPTAHPLVRRLARQNFYGELVFIYICEFDELIVFFIDGPEVSDTEINVLRASGKPIVVVLTHGPTFRGSARLIEELNAKVLLHSADQSNSWLGSNARFCQFWSSDCIQMHPAMMVYQTGGHSDGHALIHLKGDGGALFSGDELYSRGRKPTLDPSVRRNGSYDVYRQRLAAIVSGCEFAHVFPFHYDAIINPGASACKWLADLMPVTHQGRNGDPDGVSVRVDRPRPD